MTRRNRSRLPPKLPDTPVLAAPRELKGSTLVERLKRDHVAGRSARFGRDEVHGVMNRVVGGAAPALLGLAPFEGLTFAYAEAAVAATYGWEGDGPRARIAPSCTALGFTAACERVLEVARAGGRLAFATARPASLLPLHRALAVAATEHGAEVLHADESGTVGPDGQRLRWIDRVAVLTDGVSLLGDDRLDASEELLFALPRPDLVVADRGFAGAALNAGLEVVAFADLDALAFAVAAWQGRAIRVVPLDERRPPSAYRPLLELVEQLAADPVAEPSPM